MKRWVRYILIAILLIFPVVFISLTYLEDIAETNGGTGPKGIIPLLTGLPHLLIKLASGAGYIGIFALMLLEAAAFPVPSEIILPFAGYLVSQGTMEFWAVVFYSTLAALIGSFVDYYLGWKLGGSLLTGRSRLPYVTADHLRRSQVWFNRHGPIAVAFFRLVPAARVLISFPAGAYRMSKPKFAIYPLAGCMPWNLVLVYLGWWLGSSWEAVVAAFRYINLVVYALLILLALWVVLRLTSKRSKRTNR
jgi:membrane protein DedA with SNARE-associated domain